MRFSLWLRLALEALVTGCVTAQMTTRDRLNWHKAIELYIKGYGKSGIRSYRTTLADYSHVYFLETKALAHAHAHGVLPVASYSTGPLSTGARREQTHYFTSIIRPGSQRFGRLTSQLHTDMELGYKSAFAFWRHENGRFKLLQIDTLDDLPAVKWPLERLEDVVGHG